MSYRSNNARRCDAHLERARRALPAGVLRARATRLLLRTRQHRRRRRRAPIQTRRQRIAVAKVMPILIIMGAVAVVVVVVAIGVLIVARRRRPRRGALRRRRRHIDDALAQRRSGRRDRLSCGFLRAKPRHGRGRGRGRRGGRGRHPLLRGILRMLHIRGRGRGRGLCGNGRGCGRRRLRSRFHRQFAQAGLWETRVNTHSMPCQRTKDVPPARQRGHRAAPTSACRWAKAHRTTRACCA